MVYDKNVFFSQVMECSECEFDELVQEVEQVTLGLRLVSKTSTKFQYSVGHELRWSGGEVEHRAIIFKKNYHWLIMVKC